MKDNHNNQNDDAIGPPAPDELDGLLREWHSANAAKAAAGRDRLMASLAQEDSAGERDVLARIEPKTETMPSRRPLAVIRRIIVNRYAPLAAAMIVLAVLVPFMFTGKSGFVNTSNAQVSNVVMAPDGGRLDAFDQQGNALGPCALKHTDVKAEISGRFTRVTVVQKYQNPNPDKIEAVYTFPLSDRAGVDRMTMTIGDRVIAGEVRERQQARRIYEQAKQSNRVASLLEQERPNIFTQSIANIEPGATIDISISYVEMVAEHDGEFSFVFPTVVSPRYIPGGGEYQRRDTRELPANVRVRRGLIFWAPATVSNVERREAIAGERSAEELRTMLGAATPIEAPDNAEGLPAVWYQATAAYPDGSAEPTVLLVDGRGSVGGRWFYCPPAVLPSAEPGSNFAQPTAQVPDANRITPMPTRPGVRAGHDISISVLMDTGGPGITFLDSPQHTVARTDLARNTLDQARRVSLALANLSEIPNRDFVLKWKQTSDAISSRVFAHTGDTGNFFTVQLDPPTAVKEFRAVPRELVFVVDTSGSMNGKPMAMCKEVMRKAIDEMRPQDTFNIITFAGATRILWDRPRPNTTANREEGQRFIDGQQGRGGTEMMAAIEAALRQAPVAGMGGAITPAQLADLPADGRQVAVEADDSVFRSEGLTKNAVTDRAELHIRDDLSIKCSPFALPEPYLKRAARTVQDENVTLKLLMRGAWTTVNGERVFQVASAEMSGDSSVRPLRLVMFLTDAEVGNDFAIIEAIKRNRATTRVFSFGIGSSVNRYLIEQMALAGGGEPEFIYANQATEQQASEAVERFNRRTRTPILTDIRVTFNGVQPLDVLPEMASVQDLWDNRPLTFMGRYAAAGVGTLTIKGQTAQGPWERTIPIEFPARQAENSSLPTLWARAKIDTLIGSDLLGAQRGQPNPEIRSKVVTLGETFNVMSQYTSFVAVDKLRVTVDGRARLVHVPVELPDQTNWEGFFGELTPLDDETVKLRAAAGGKVETMVAERLAFKTAVLDQLVASNETMLKQREVRTAGDGDGEGKKNLHYFGSPVVTATKPGDPRSSGSPTQPADGQTAAAAGASPMVDASSAVFTPVAPPAAPAGGARGGSAGSQPSNANATKELASAAAGAALPATTPAPAMSSPPAPAAKVTPPVSGVVGGAPALRTEESAKGSKDERNAAAQIARGIVERELIRESSVNLGVQPGHSADTFLHGFQTRRSKLDSASSAAGTGQGNFDFSLQDLSTTDRYDSVPQLDLNRVLRGYQDALGNGVAGDSSAGLGFLELGGALSAASGLIRGTDTVNGSILTLAAAQLVESGRIEEAKRLLCPIVPEAGKDKGLEKSVDPSGEQKVARAATPPEQLCEAINSGLPDAERLAAVRGARHAAAADLLARRRATIIARKVAPDVQMQMATLKKMDAVDGRDKSDVDGKQAAAKGQAGAARLVVTILLSDTSAKTLDALKALGLTIISVKQEASVVVARVGLERVEELAMLDVVRRVELVPEEEGKKVE